MQHGRRTCETENLTRDYKTSWCLRSIPYFLVGERRADMRSHFEKCHAVICCCGSPGDHNKRCHTYPSKHLPCGLECTWWTVIETGREKIVPSGTQDGDLEESVISFSFGMGRSQDYLSRVLKLVRWQNCLCALILGRQHSLTVECMSPEEDRLPQPTSEDLRRFLISRCSAEISINMALKCVELTSLNQIQAKFQRYNQS